MWKAFIPDEQTMMQLGIRMADNLTDSAVIYLQGDLGAGKSTLARGFIQGQGYTGHVKSPTYTLVEPYQINDRTIYHMDLYRLFDPEELEFIGIRDCLASQMICLIEWPDNGRGFLPQADLLIEIHYSGQGREVSIEAPTKGGQKIIDKL